MLVKWPLKGRPFSFEARFRVVRDLFYGRERL